MAVYRFSDFQLDTDSGELRRSGALIYLEPQVAQVLTALVQSGGRVVTRAELQDLLWPDTYTDRERGLNNVINRARKVLGDSAVTPQWIETIPKRGYRFLASVEAPPESRRFQPWIWVATAAAVLLVAIGAWSLRPKSQDRPPPAEYWSALAAIRSGTTRQLQSARDLLETAIRKDPTFAPAYSELAPLLLDLVDSGKIKPETGRRRASEVAQIAIRLRGDSAAAHVAMATVLLRVNWKLRLAEREIERALWLDPKSAEAWRQRATLLLTRGDTAHAVEAAERSVALDPLSPWTQTASGRALFYAGDASRSAARLEETLRTAPQFGPAHSYLSDVYWQIGRQESARQQFLDAVRLSGMDPSEIQQIETRVARGLPAFWQSQLPELYTDRNQQGIPYKLAIRHLELGKPEQALDWLERALPQRDSRLLFLRVNPQFDGVRSSPRFRAILDRLPS